MSDEPIDYGVFDGLSSMIFYPQRTWTPTPEGALDLDIPLPDGAQLSSRFYPLAPDAPTLLFFHGNGEVACEYDAIAPDYHAAGTGLWVVDFRGYGRSTGRPLFSHMVDDARDVFEFARQTLTERGHRGALFVKGRSLGTHPALEIAARYPAELRGLIVESGASALAGLAARGGLDPADPRVEAVLRGHDAKLRSIGLSLLIIHGEHDELVPLATARDLLTTIGSSPKELVVIRGAGHNDLLWRGRTRYFDAVGRFIAGEEPVANDDRSV